MFLNRQHDAGIVSFQFPRSLGRSGGIASPKAVGQIKDIIQKTTPHGTVTESSFGVLQKEKRGHSRFHSRGGNKETQVCATCNTCPHSHLCLWMQVGPLCGAQSNTIPLHCTVSLGKGPAVNTGGQHQVKRGC